LLPALLVRAAATHFQGVHREDGELVRIGSRQLKGQPAAA
jgi:hypothetical protein